MRESNWCCGAPVFVASFLHFLSKSITQCSIESWSVRSTCLRKLASGGSSGYLSQILSLHINQQFPLPHPHHQHHHPLPLPPYDDDDDDDDNDDNNNNNASGDTREIPLPESFRHSATL